MKIKICDWEKVARGTINILTLGFYVDFKG
jgi:hypothetical protein